MAASPPLIDVVATDVPDLLRKLNGRTIRRFDGATDNPEAGRTRPSESSR